MAFASRPEFRSVIDQRNVRAGSPGETANLHRYAALVLRDSPHLAG